MKLTPQVLRAFLFVLFTGSVVGCSGSSGSMPAVKAKPVVVGPKRTAAVAPGAIPTANPALRVSMTAFSVQSMLSAPSHVLQAISSGPDNNMWFVDEAGKYIGSVATTGAAGPVFSLPAAESGTQTIISGPDNNLWINEQVAGKIARLTTAGALTEWNLSICHPSGIIGVTVGPDNNLWMADYTANMIDTITPLGSLQIFPSSGALTTSSGPWNITTGPDGNLWFTEIKSGKIGKMSPSGALLAEYSMPSSSGGPLNAPAAIIAGPDGNLWVSEWPCQPALGSCTSSVGRLIKVTTSGNMTPYTIQSNGGIAALAVGPDGNIWGSLYEAGEVFAFSPTTDQVVGYTSALSNVDAWGISAGPDGNMWVVAGGHGNGNVYRVGTGANWGSFQPNSIPNLALWLDGADTSTMIINGTAVSQWNDKSGNGHNAAQTNAAMQPTLVSNAHNGHSSLHFSSANRQFLLASVPFVNTSGTLFVTYIQNNLYGRELYARANDGYNTIGYYSPQAFGFDDEPITNYADAWPHATSGVYFNGAGAPLTSNAYVIQDAVWPSLENGTYYLAIGTDPDNQQQYATDGDISEVLYYTAALSTAQRQQVEGYLACKWGLQAQLPSTHPYATTCP